MRTALMTVFLVVALQGIASASSAFASPEDEIASAPGTLEVPSVTPPEQPDASKTQVPLRTDTERQPVASRFQVLSKNFQSPKPVQIYWFFGGR